MATGTIKGTGWTLAGTSTSNSQNVTYPATATELFIYGQVTGNQNKPIYSGIFPVDLLTTEMLVLVLGGYYENTNDHGYAYVNYNKTNRTVSLRALRYGDRTGGKVYVYYR